MDFWLMPLILRNGLNLIEPVVKVRWIAQWRAVILYSFNADENALVLYLPRLLGIWMRFWGILKIPENSFLRKEASCPPTLTLLFYQYMFKLLIFLRMHNQNSIFFCFRPFLYLIDISINTYVYVFNTNKFFKRPK